MFNGLEHELMHERQARLREFARGPLAATTRARGPFRFLRRIRRHSA